MAGLNGFARLMMALVLAGLSAAASPLVPSVRAQEEDRATTRLEQSLPEGSVMRVRELARELSQEGIPPVLIHRKALEGVAKGVPPERIVEALDVYAGRLREARGLIGDGQGAASLAAAAEAVRRGVPSEAIRDVARQGAGRGNGGAAVPLLVLGELAEAGVPADRAQAAVEEAMRRGAPVEGMMDFSAAVRRRVRQGEDPAAAFEQVRIRALERMRNSPGGAQIGPRGDGGRRPSDASPVPPGSEPPMGSGGSRRGPGGS